MAYTIRFYLHSKVLADGARPVFVDVRWADSVCASPDETPRLRTGMGLSCHPEQWHPDKNRFKAGARDYAKHNRALTACQAALDKHLADAELHARAVRTEDLKALVKPRAAVEPAAAAPRSPTLTQVCQQWQQHYRAKHSANYLRRPTSVVQHLETFRPDVRAADFVRDPTTHRCELFDSFVTYLLEDAPRWTGRKQVGFGLSNNSVSRHISILRTLLKFAGIAADWMEDDLRHEVELEPLEYEEVMRIATTALEDPRLRRVRDTFVFACFTGPRWSNLATLKPGSVVETAGVRTLVYTQVKGRIKEKVRVALAPEASEIWDRYAGQLHVPSNQEVNRIVKLAAKAAGIDRLVTEVRQYGSERREHTAPFHELITCHTARRTFATLLIEGDASLVDVQEGLGHSSLTMARKYAKRRAAQRHVATLSALDKVRGAHLAESVPRADENRRKIQQEDQRDAA